MLKRCNLDIQKFPSLDIHGVTKDYHQIQRKLSCEKNGNASRHGNNEKHPRIDQLSQQIQPMSVSERYAGRKWNSSL